MNQGAKQRLYDEMNKIVQASLTEEFNKFEEAIYQVTGERVTQYLQTKMGDNYKEKEKQIISSKNYQNIVSDTVEEFKEFYTFEV